MTKSALWFLSVFLVCPNVFAQVETLTAGVVVDSSMASGERHIYRLDLESGQFAHVGVDQLGIDLVVAVIGPDGEPLDEVDSPTGAQGTEELQIVADAPGAYQLELYPFEGMGRVEPGDYRIRVEVLLSAEDYRQRLETKRARREAAVEWLRSHAIPINGVEAEQGFEDMQPLRRIVGDARLVALGEATHGTREFFQLKHRILEFLVTEMGFNLFAIEATMPEAFDVNEYVLTGKGDPEKALTGLYFWTWNTEEVLEMIRWMRRYNADPDHPRKVKFYGFDMQFGTRALRVLVEYLNRVDRSAAERLGTHEALSLIAKSYTSSDFAHLPDEDRRSALDAVASTIQALDDDKNAYVRQTGEADWDLARLHAQILIQYLRMNSGDMDWMDRSAVRDSSMAANIGWILEHEGPDARIVVWAHNGHVGDGEMGTGATMGRHLRERYGQNMKVFGFAFHQGAFQAIEMPFERGRELMPFHVTPLPEGSLDATLGATGLPVAAFDLHEVPESGQVAEWFAEPRRTRSIGSGYSPGISSAFAPRVTELYDALLFVDETTSARPNPGGTRPFQRTRAVPENLDFESGQLGLVPEGWDAHRYWLANFDYTVETSDEQPRQGEQCVRISRPPGRHYGEMHGSLSQRLDAAPYRGKRVRLKAAVRAEVDGQGNQAYLWLSANGAGFGPQARLFHESMRDRPITNPEWRFVEITREVPEEAEWITFGAALTGEGRAWFDAFSLEIVGTE